MVDDDSESCSLNLNFCSPWVYCDDGECQCGEAPNQILQCNIETNVFVLDGNCLTYNKDKHVTEVRWCILKPTVNIHYFRGLSLNLTTSCVANRSTGLVHCVVSVKMATIPLFTPLI